MESNQPELLGQKIRPGDQANGLNQLPPPADCPFISSRLGRAREVLAHYDWRQLVRRASKMVLSRVLPRHVRPALAPTNLKFQAPDPAGRELIELLVAEYSRKGLTRNEELSGGLIRLLNETKSLGHPLDWDRAQTASHLWRFQLHYHEFLLPLLELNPTLVGQILESWLARFASNIDTRSDAWHPYCVSRRAQVWCWVLAKVKLPSPLKSRLTNSLYQQIRYLANHLEWDPGGNHLLENLFAIGLARVFLVPNGELPSSNQVGQWIRTELRRQVLEHGEHYERSPMYHAHILSRLLLLIGLSSREREDLFQNELRQTAEKMLRFLDGVCHPDGEIPLFGDSGFDETLSTSTVRQLAEVVGVRSVPAEGPWVGPYWVHRTNNTFVVMDTGEVAAPTLPAHGHCDLLGWEGSIAGLRWFVDSGNFDYEDSPMRRYCRSSLAHNVVTVNRGNHCRVWSKFRMGRRAKVWERRHGRAGAVSWMWARHNSLKPSSNAESSRLVAAEGDTLVCADFPRNAPVGLIEGWLHLAPELQILRLDRDLFRLQNGAVTKYLKLFGVAKVELFQAWYCPSFGARQANVVVGYSFAEGTAAAGWSLASDESFRIEIVDRGLCWTGSSEFGEMKEHLWEFKKCTLS